MLQLLKGHRPFHSPSAQRAYGHLTLRHLTAPYSNVEAVRDVSDELRRTSDGDAPIGRISPALIATMMRISARLQVRQMPAVILNIIALRSALTWSDSAPISFFCQPHIGANLRLLGSIRKPFKRKKIRSQPTAPEKWTIACVRELRRVSSQKAGHPLTTNPGQALQGQHRWFPVEGVPSELRAVREADLFQ